MKKEQFNEGINFFYDFVDLSISSNIILVFYDDKTIEPRIMNASVYNTLYCNTQEDKNTLAYYRLADTLSEEQMEDMNRLENKLRIQRGCDIGEFLGEEQFNCPITRSAFTYGRFQDAEVLLKIFIHQATLDGLSSIEMQDFLSENEGFLEKAKNTYDCFLENNLPLEKEQISVLKKFDIDCPTERNVIAKRKAAEDDNIAPNASFSPIFQYVNRLLTRRNQYEAALPENKRRKFN